MDNKFENLETLRKAAWESIAARRKYEWQISISFWGLLVSFIAALVTNKIEIAGAGWVGLLLILVPLGLCTAHCMWIVGLFHAYTIDKKDEEDLRKAMHSIVSLDSTTVAKRTEIRKMREKGPLRNWNTRSQIITTITLGLLACYIVGLISCRNEPSKSPKKSTPSAVTLPAKKEVPRR